MATRLRKTRRLRGSRTHGWGTSGQHRGSGMRGGFGKAGAFKHKRSFLLRYHYGTAKKGFTSVNQKRRASNVLNIKQLSSMLDRLIAENRAQVKDNEVTVDLGSLGISKLLGTGNLTRPITVKVDRCSEAASEKIREAGGKILQES